MKFKYLMTNISMQVCIIVISLFSIFTQLNSMRQPVKTFMYLIAFFSFISLIINIYNYIKEDKD